MRLARSPANVMNDGIDSPGLTGGERVLRAFKFAGSKWLHERECSLNDLESKEETKGTTDKMECRTGKGLPYL